MELESIFSAITSFSILAWVFLILWPRSALTIRYIETYAVPVVISALYTVLIITQASWSDFSKFSTLAGVVDLFSAPGLALAGWVHYFAFDLFVGVWESQQCKLHHMPHWIRVPCLALTFFLGPMGFLLFYICRAFWLRRQPLTT